MITLKTHIWGILLGLLWNNSAFAYIAHLRIFGGTMQYEMDSLVNKSSDATPFGIEYQSFITNDKALFFSFLRADDSESERSLFQETRIGGRFYLMNFGKNSNSKGNDSEFNYSYSFAPFIQSGLNWGHFLVSPLGQPEFYDASTEYFGIFVGGGVVQQLTDFFAISLTGGYAKLQGMSAPFKFSATTIFINVGLSFYL